MSNLSVEEEIKKSEDEVVSTLLWSIPLGFFSLIAPVLAFFGFGIPDSEKVDIWFQRSGAITVLFAAWMEYILAKSNEHINLSGIVVSQQILLSDKYKKPYRIAQYIGIVMLIIGTIIWGYGDLIYCI